MLWLAALVAAAFVSSSMGQGPPAGSPPGLDKAIAAKQKHAQRILDKPGVVGIGVGLNPAGTAVIEIYKDKDDVPDLPDSLDGVAVESVTTGVIAPRSLPTDRFPHPVPIGVSGGLSGVATGTLGARARHRGRRAAHRRLRVAPGGDGDSQVLPAPWVVERAGEDQRVV